MDVPKGKTFYIGKKKLRAGVEIPASLESKATEIFLNDKTKARDKIRKTKAEAIENKAKAKAEAIENKKGDMPIDDNPILSESEKKK